jgi:hypothetical protein
MQVYSHVWPFIGPSIMENETVINQPSSKGTLHYMPTYTTLKNHGNTCMFPGGSYIAITLLSLHGRPGRLMIYDFKTHMQYTHKTPVQQ